MEIAERCALDLDFGRFQLLPEPAVPDAADHRAYLRALCEEGMAKRYGHDVSQAVKDRLGFELGVIEKTGYVDYMLLVNEFISFAHERGIAIGVRGSAGGSIVAYALGVTNIDPMPARSLV